MKRVRTPAGARLLQWTNRREAGSCSDRFRTLVHSRLPFRQKLKEHDLDSHVYISLFNRVCVHSSYSFARTQIRVSICVHHNATRINYAWFSRGLRTFREMAPLFLPTRPLRDIRRGRARWRKIWEPLCHGISRQYVH